MHIGYLLFLLSLCLGTPGRGQSLPDTLAGGDTLRGGGLTVRRQAPEAYMQWQVKHLSEFVGRFNYERLPDGRPFTDSARVLYPRETYLRLLFNEDDPRFQKTRAGTVSLYTLRVQDFVQTVTAQKIKIPAQPALEAVVMMRVWHHQKTDTLRLRLRKSYRADSAALWQLVGVTAPPQLHDTLRLACTDTGATADLPPNAPEVGFLPLLRSLNDYHSLCPFAARGLPTDADWQRTEAALRGGMRVEAVLSTTLYLPVGTEWRLEIKEFLQEKENSGWLISDILPQVPPK